MPDLPDDPEDAKLITLARAARVRTGAAQGAAVRDTDGRTYAACSVALPSLRLSALRLAVAMAASSGAAGAEAAAVVTDDHRLSPEDVRAVHDLGGPGLPVFRSAPDGSVAESART